MVVPVLHFPCYEPVAEQRVSKLDSPEQDAFSLRIGTLEPRSMWPALTCLAQWGIGVVAAALETRASNPVESQATIPKACSFAAASTDEVSAVPAFPCHEDGLCTPELGPSQMIEGPETVGFRIR